MVLLLWLACSRPGPPPPAVGTWGLEGADARGFLVLSARECRLGLWTPRLSTGGPDGARCVVEAGPEANPAPRLVFPLRVGAGDATAAATWTAEGLVLPLSARPGEAELRLRRVQPAPTDPERQALAQQQAAVMAASRDAWRAGRFVLEEGGQVVGELRFVADEPTRVWVYDPTWLSDGEQLASQVEEGPDLLLSFPVMPSLRGELGMLRVQRLTGQAVVPLGAEPTPDDRVLTLRPGGLDEATRAARIAQAQAGALAVEDQLLSTLAPRLAQEAAATTPPCAGLPDPGWELALAGYALRLLPEPGGCVVELSPQPVQHLRRLSVLAGPEGVRERVVHE